jgi:hypothetical protein
MTYPGPPEQPDPASNPSYPPPPAYPNLPPTEGTTPPSYPAAPPPGYGQPPPGYGTPPPPGFVPPFGYPAPPGYPAYGQLPPKKRRRWPWIVFTAVLVLVVVLVIVGVMFGREGSDNPKEAVSRFWAAAASHDLDKTERLLCPGKKLPDTFREAAASITSYSIGPESGSGSTRNFPVTVQLTYDGSPSTLIITTVVKKQTGKWYVCDFSQ